MAESTLLNPAPFDLPFPFPDLASADLPAAEFATGDLSGDFVFDPDLDLHDFDFDFDLDLPSDPSLPPPPPSSGDPSSSSSGIRAPSSPDSGSSAASAVTGGDARRKNEEESPDPDPNPRSTKARRLDEDEEEAKRRARLVRNRESAHLSRQRKKLYVEELEEKVKAMHATIADLTTKISYVTAENASLRQQLGGSTNLPPPPPLPYPALYPLPPPWIPAYAMRGSHVPLVPIPRLKPQQPAPAPPAKKAKKVETKNSEGRTKKVASVSLLGLLCLLMVCGALVTAVNHMYDGIDTGKGAMLRPSHHGRVLAVEGRPNDGPGGTDPKLAQNASETLPALLYLPRNGQHVKINGNLVIKSVLASEKSIAHMSSENEKSSGSRGKEETSLAIPGYLAPPEAGKVPESKKRTADHLMALAPGNGNAYSKDDGLLPQWFSEAMAGPMLSSGMCTEVFQFDVSPTSAHANGIVPVYSTVSSNSSRKNSTGDVPPSHAGKMKNRRILYSKPIPLGEATSNNTRHLKTPKNDSYGGKKPIPSVVVSVLADPREAGDGDSEGRISSNSLSRIFVVVLIDSVQYVTYSCVLPFKNHSPHL